MLPSRTLSAGMNAFDFSACLSPITNIYFLAAFVFFYTFSRLSFIMDAPLKLHSHTQPFTAIFCLRTVAGLSNS